MCFYTKCYFITAFKFFLFCSEIYVLGSKLFGYVFVARNTFHHKLHSHFILPYTFHIRDADIRWPQICEPHVQPYMTYIYIYIYDHIRHIYEFRKRTHNSTGRQKSSVLYLRKMVCLCVTHRYIYSMHIRAVCNRSTEYTTGEYINLVKK